MAVHSGRLRSPHEHPPDSRTGSPASSPLQRSGRRGIASRALSYAATAGLLALTLAVGFATMRPLAPEAPGEPQWTPVMARAFAAAGGVDDIVLAEAVFGLDQLPAGSKEVIFYRLTVPPGVTLTALAGPSCGCPGWPVSGGVGAEVIQAGRYTLRLAAPLEVQRSGVAPGEAIAAHTAVTLGPGDAAIYPDYTAAAEIRVDGDVPVQLLGVAIVGADGSGEPAPMLPDEVRGEELSRSLASDWEKLAGGPVAVSLRQVTLPAGLRIGPYEPIGIEAMRVERGEISRYYFQPGTADPTGPPMKWYAGRTTPLLGINPGMRYDLTSGNKEPSELLVLILEPAGITAQTLAP